MAWTHRIPISGHRSVGELSACGRFRELRPRDYCFRGQRGCPAARTGARHCANSAWSSIGWPSRSVHRHTLKGGIHLLRSQAPLRAVSWNWAVECGSGSRERERAARRSSNMKMGRRKPAGLGRPSPAGVAAGCLVELGCRMWPGSRGESVEVLPPLLLLLMPPSQIQAVHSMSRLALSTD